MDKKTQKPKELKSFDVVVECLVPSKITFKVLAEDENEAIDKVNSYSPHKFIPNISKRKNIKATVYDSGTINIKASRNFK